MDNASHKIMPYISNNRFANYPNEKLHNIIMPSCLMYLKKWLRSRSQHATHLAAWNAYTEHLELTHHHVQPVVPEIIWIGHASFLVKIGSYTILTDPVFHNLTPLFPRHQAPGIDRAQLPAIDAVIISHNHPDHLEKSTIIHLAKTHNPLFLVPQGDGAMLRHWGISKVAEHMWWDTYTLSHNHDAHALSFTFLPAHHWSGRWLIDANRSLWGSWMMSYNGYHCYFAGDTAYSHHFAAIAQEFPMIHTALMPIGPCEPSEYLRKSHISSEEAGAAFLDLNAHHFIPMHWGTFGFGVDHPLDPLHRLEAWWQRTMTQELSARHTLVPLRIGQQLVLSSRQVARAAHLEQQGIVSVI